MTRPLGTIAPLLVALLPASAPAQNSTCGNTPGNPDATIAACTPLIKQIRKQQSHCHDEMIWASSEHVPADGSPPLLPNTFTNTGCSGYVPAPALVRRGRSGSSGNSHHGPLPAPGYEPPPDPDLNQALNLRADAYLAKGKFDAAIDDYDSAAKISQPASAEFLYHRALAYHGLNNDSHAVDDFTASIKIDPSNPAVWADRCRSRAILGKYPQAITDCDTSLELLAVNPAAYKARGLVNLKLHKYALAIVDYTTAIQISQPTAVSLYGRGVAKRASGDPASAAVDTSAALKLNPAVPAIFKRYRVSLK